MDDEVLAVCGAQQRHIDEQQHGEGSRGVHQAGVGMREDERGGVKCKKHATVACNINMECPSACHGPAVHH